MIRTGWVMMISGGHNDRAALGKGHITVGVTARDHFSGFVGGDELVIPDGIGHPFMPGDIIAVDLAHELPGSLRIQGSTFIP